MDKKLKLYNYINVQDYNDSNRNIIYSFFTDEYFNNLIKFRENINGRKLSEDEKREIAIEVLYLTITSRHFLINYNQEINYYPIIYFLPINIGYISQEMEEAFYIEMKLKNLDNYLPNNYEKIKELAMSIYERYKVNENYLPGPIPIGSIFPRLPEGYKITEEMEKIFSKKSKIIRRGDNAGIQRLWREIYINVTKAEQKQHEKKKMVHNEFINSMKYHPLSLEKKLKLNNEFDSNKVNITNQNFNTLRQIGFTNNEIDQIVREPLIIKRMLKTFKESENIGENVLQQMRNIEDSLREQKKMLKENKNVKKY